MLGQRAVTWSVVIGATLCALTTGCTNADETGAATEPPTSETVSPSPRPSSTSKPPHSSASPTPERIPRVFDPKNFDPAGSDFNQWVPMAPGVQIIRKGFVTVGGRRIPHLTVTTITDVTKKIDGVRSVLVLDQDIDGGQVSEQAVDYLAEDVGGNVWYLGSYTEAYESGQFLNAQDAWLAGVSGASAGLYFPGDPKPGSAPYYQVQVPGGEQSSAQVVKAGQRACVPFDCFKDVIVVLEGGAENKYWAPGVGQILTEPLSGIAQETEELINVKELSPSALSELSAEVLKLDAHAAQTVPSVFGPSNPAVRER
jgi:hypothetical protein